MLLFCPTFQLNTARFHDNRISYRMKRKYEKRWVMCFVKMVFGYVLSCHGAVIFQVKQVWLWFPLDVIHLYCTHVLNGSFSRFAFSLRGREKQRRCIKSYHFTCIKWFVLYNLCREFSEYGSLVFFSCCISSNGLIIRKVCQSASNCSVVQYKLAKLK